MTLCRGLYFIADTGLLSDRKIFAVTRAALEGGVVLVQLRAKDTPVDEVIRLARGLVGICGEYNVPLIVNDLPAVAARAGAAGVHVGLEDTPVAEARRLLGPEAIVGATTPTPEALRRAEAEGASYVAAGPMFRSPTKPEKPVAGPELARQLRPLTDLPLCVIGGITAENVGELAGPGIDLVCVVSAIAAAPDPRAATEELVEAIRVAGLVG
ncbi:MAG: thiamine phosphate synthase [candidate division WS1 bacterium]|jgi:thiamine-phosphate pyrophosphorylase|nr:thiamine phosphate synthase [candidate division WS1 bacterium]